MQKIGTTNYSNGILILFSCLYELLLITKYSLGRADDETDRNGSCYTNRHSIEIISSDILKWIKTMRRSSARLTISWLVGERRKICGVLNLMPFNCSRMIHLACYWQLFSVGCFSVVLGRRNTGKKNSKLRFHRI